MPAEKGKATMSTPNVAARAYLVVLALGLAAAILYTLADLWHIISPITGRELSLMGLGAIAGFAFCGLIASRDYKDLERRGHQVECRNWACRHRDNPWSDPVPQPSEAKAGPSRPEPSGNIEQLPASASR